MTNPGEKARTVRDVLLARRGIVFLSRGSCVDDDLVRAVELELAELGYVLTSRLRARVAASTRDELCAWRTWALGVLSAALGADRRHEPLFRSFPAGIPGDTIELWWDKVLIYYLQAEGTPCLFCRNIGTTHVLNPCEHVVCDHCWDGANYSACPVCEHHVDRSSPFFKPAPGRDLSPRERVTFKLLDLGEDIDREARALFVSLCERKQALSPSDRDALGVLLQEYRSRVLTWLPEKIPVRENIAIIFGTLVSACAPDDILPVARRFMTTATDVLRFLAVLSGADASLQKQVQFKAVQLALPDGRPLDAISWWQKLAIALGRKPAERSPALPVYLPIESNRFKMVKLGRPLRRTLLALLEGIPEDRLIEDMLRHRSSWVWAGEFLHPGEYARRYPRVAAAFAVVRKKAPDGTKAPAFRGYYSKVEAAITKKDAVLLSTVLAERPGELARRFDLSLRIAGDDEAACGRVLDTFAAKMPAFATPVLLTLRSLLPTRTAPLRRRLFWPKGQISKGVSTNDTRKALPARAIAQSTAAIDAELCARFAKKPPFEDAIVDEALRSIIVPFNERTASRAAVALPRGSRVPVPPGKTLRLFLHWCQPQRSAHATDLDLSVGFYDDRFRYVGVCSYYQLKATGKDGAVIAVSAGDMRDAPYPEGATELVDLHRDAALAEGIRYAVMVVNAYSGLTFDRLERAFAGLMLRDDAEGAHFDPRTVALKFALTGANGTFMPLVLDVAQSTLHWLDVYSEGQLAFNNVRTSNTAITRTCPEMIDYFASGVRPSMFDLALYHAAARARRVFLRGAADSVAQFVRRPGEDVLSFHGRLTRGEADEPRARLPWTGGPSVLAILYRGDIDLPHGSAAYALFRERVTPSIAASDLLS